MADQDWAPRIRWIIEAYADSRQQTLADRIGVTQGTVSAWASGTEPKGDALAAILKAYPEISPDYLMLGREPRVRTHSDSGGLVAVRRAATIIRRALRDLEEELSDEVTIHGELEDAYFFLQKHGFEAPSLRRWLVRRGVLLKPDKGEEGWEDFDYEMEVDDEGYVRE